MKRFVFILLMLTAASVHAQEIEVPRIDSVYVDRATGMPVVTWSMSAPGQVDGYIIKRKIVDGEGVIPGTYNNVAIINGGHTFRYVDTSKAYNTSARPMDRLEYYRVSAFRKTDERTYYSLMSDEEFTLQISGQYDFCTDSYQLACSQLETVYEGQQDAYFFVSQYPGHADTICERSPSLSALYDDFAKIRTFSAHGFCPHKVYHGSGFLDLEAREVIRPSVFNIGNITLGDDGESLCLTLNISESPSVRRLSLLRRCGDFCDTLLVEPDGNACFSLTDRVAEPARQYTYRLLAINECGNVIKKSDARGNLVLGVSGAGKEQKLLEWNLPENIQPDATVDVLCQIDDSPMETIATLPIGSLRYSHNSHASADGFSNGRVRYQLIARYLDADGKEQTAASNMVSSSGPPVMYVPNALNPESDIEENRIFRPVANFVEGYSLTILNKRGVVLFHTQDVNEGWDGRDRTSHFCAPDTYIYVIRYQSASGEKLEKKGWVNLVR